MGELNATSVVPKHLVYPDDHGEGEHMTWSEAPTWTDFPPYFLSESPDKAGKSSIDTQDTFEGDAPTASSVWRTATFEDGTPTSRVISSFVLQASSLRDRDSEELSKIASEFGTGVASRILSMISFADCPDLLRGVPVESIMRGWGIWKDSKGSLETYALSVPTTKIHSFISHNWGVSPVKKYLSTCYHFNLALGFWASVLACILASILTAFELVPHTWDRRFDGHHYPVGSLARLVYIPAFFIGLFFGRSFLALFKCRGPLVFLDKICIHQVDKDAQEKGIAKLGAFLRRSDHMLVLYDKPYLNKVWTIYEVAAFLVQHPADKMKFLPINMTVLLCVNGVVFFIFNFALLEARSVGGGEIVNFIAMSGLGFINCFYYRRWCREKIPIQERLRTFSVRNCLCTHEPDRAVVYDNILVLLKVFKKVSRCATTEEGLTAFDKIVQEELPKRFGAVFGYCTQSYGELLVLAFLLSGGQFFDTLSTIPIRDDSREAWSGLLVYPVFFFIVWPGLHAGVEMLFAFFIDASKPLQVIWFCFVPTLPGVVLILPVHTGIELLWEKSIDSDIALVFLCLAAVVPTLVGVVLLLLPWYWKKTGEALWDIASIRSSSKEFGISRSMSKGSAHGSHMSEASEGSPRLNPQVMAAKVAETYDIEPELASI